MRTAIVTGGGTGIGRAAALHLARLGYAVAVAGRREAPLKKVAAEIAKKGGHAMAVATDVSHEAAVQELFQRFMARWKRIDVLVNAAGAVVMLPLAQMSADQWRQMLDVNLSAAFYAMRAVWPVMAAQHAKKRRAKTPHATGGTIINISSMASRDPFPGLAAYAAAKAGVNMLTLAAGREGDAVGIRVCCIAPGMVDTPMFRGLLGDRGIPADRVMRPEDIAALIGDIVSGSLRYCSGETIFARRRPV